VRHSCRSGAQARQGSKARQLLRLRMQLRQGQLREKVIWGSAVCNALDFLRHHLSVRDDALFITLTLNAG
jgi:hypothetical protein